MRKLGEARLFVALWAATVAAMAWLGSRLPVPVPVARSELPTHLSAEASHTLGLRWNLNQASQLDLARVPGIGRLRAEALVRARRRLGAFARWDQVGAVRGVGPVALDALRRDAELGPSIPP